MAWYRERHHSESRPAPRPVATFFPTAGSMRGGAKWRAFPEERVPQKLMLMYGIWLAICGLAAWYLARGSARRRLNDGVFAVLVLVALINVAQLVYVFGFGESIIVRPRNAFEKYLQHTAMVWYTLYALWPFAAAIGVAQTSLRISSRPALARWLSFGCSVGIAVLTPLFLFFTTCGLAGACLG